MTEYGLQNLHLLIGRETTWGTSVTPDKDVGLVQSVTVNERNNIIYSHALGSANTASAVAGKYELAFTVELQLQHLRMLEYATARGATVSHTDEGGGVHSHEWTPSATGALSSFTADVGMDASSDIVTRALGCKVNSTRLSQDLDGVLSLSADVIAKRCFSSSSTGTLSTNTTGAFPASYAALSYGVENSEAAANLVQSFEWNHNNNVIQSYALGSRLPGAFTGGKIEDSFSFSLVFDDTTEQARFWGSASNPNDGSISEGGLIFKTEDSTPTQSVEVDFDNITFNEISKPYTLDNVVMQDITGRARSIETIKGYDNIASASWG